MALHTPRDLFLHELSDILSAEHAGMDMLKTFESESNNDDVKSAMKAHQRETKQQIDNVEKVFKQLGATPEKEPCYAAEGLSKELEALHKENPSPIVLEAGNLGAAAKTEHYEMASYNMLIQMAKDLGEPDAEALLKENLDQEKEMARKVESLSRQVGKDAKAEMKKQA